MYLSKIIDVPAGTTVEDKQRTTMYLADGVIREIWIQGRRGIGGYVFLTIRRFMSQLVPEGSDAIMVTRFPIKVPLMHGVSEPPRRLRIYTWSPEADNDHKIFVGVYLQSWEHFLLEYGAGVFK